ncbi:hypothetical protein GCM10009634_82880 [Saccharothrix xinjiangensis]
MLSGECHPWSTSDDDFSGGTGSIRVPYWGKWHGLAPGRQVVNRSYVRIRALGERAVSIPELGGYRTDSAAPPPASPA